MIDRLQRLIDDLAERLQRSVAVDDRAMGLIANSRHYGDEDQVRVRNLVSRMPEPAAIRYAYDQGIRSLNEVTRIAGNDDLALLPRLCFPLRSRGVLLGWLWVIDDGQVTDAQVADATGVSRQLAEILQRRVAAEEEEEDERDELMRDLLAPGEPRGRDQAAQELVARGLLDAAPHYLACAVVPAPAPGAARAAGRDLVLSAVRHSVRQATGSSPPGTWVTVVAADAVVALRSAHHGAPPDRVRTWCGWVLRHARSAPTPHAGQVRVGAGSVVGALTGVWASAEQAAHAVRAAAATGDEVAVWDDLTPSQLAQTAVLQPVPGHLVPPALASLHSRLGPDHLRTLECVLDHAGDVARVAEELMVHRSTVYYRLARVEEALGHPLSDGRTRLAVHWWLKARAHQPWPRG